MSLIMIILTAIAVMLFENEAFAKKPIYYSCPSIGYGATLTYGGTYHRAWRVFYPGTAESVSFVKYTQCNVTCPSCNSNQEFNCYFRFQNNVDGFQEQTGLDGTLTRKLPNHRDCQCVSKTTVKCR